MKVKGRPAADWKTAIFESSADGRLAKPLTFIRRSIKSAAEVNAVAALDVELITSDDYSQCDQPSIRVFPMRFNWLSLIQERLVSQSRVQA